ncbi:MAG: transcriptional regulator [Flammeovirgaceae bacterium]|nr:transcriptional regulator [Flammeovirgaceae bacterium]MBE62175.1 transcriptional regulator [Flammeovirgaceae bacterium]|tara:strand:+ start:350 stop:712 length:363 start_codon:yes stop_codon:yes gene_type:complete
MTEVTELDRVKNCSGEYVLAVNDTLSVISGKWKLPIIGSLLFGKKRHKDLQSSVGKITPRMLSKELKELELNGIIKRTVYDTTPVRVEYELTESGFSIRSVLDVMVEWGLEHRERVMGSN